MNSQANLHITGLELTWQQPLDVLLNGLGLTANYTYLSQSSSDPSALATGISPENYNFGVYYSLQAFSTHVTYVRQEGYILANAPQNNLNLPLREDPVGWLDASMDYWLPIGGGDMVQIVLDGKNLSNSHLRSTFGFEEQTYSAYWPGRQYILGFRARF